MRKRKRVLYIQYTNPAGYPPLEHSSRILADRGWDVMFLGTGSFGADTLRFPEHPCIQVRQLSFCPSGWRQKLHYIWFFLWIMGWVARWRPDWIYASDLWACPPAAVLATVFRRRVIYHEHDSPNLDVAKSAFPKLCLYARGLCGRHARRCVLPNGERAKQFEAETRAAKPAAVVWNCPSLREVLPAPRSPNGRELKLLYQGSIVPERLPLSVVDALAMLPEDVTLRVVGYETVGSRGYADKLCARAKELGISRKLLILGALPMREDMLRVCRDSDVGLVLLPAKSTDCNMQAMTGASNKPFDYLACGLPMLVSPLPDWVEFIVEPGYGLSCDPCDANAITQTIRHLYDDPVLMRGMGERGRIRVLEEWNYDSQFSGLVVDLDSEQ